MRKVLFILFGIISFTGFGQSVKDKSSWRIVVENVTASDRENVLVRIPPSKIKSSKNDLVVFIDDKEVASQYNVKDELNDGLLFVIDRLKAKEKKEIEIRSVQPGGRAEYVKRTQAELSRKEGGEWKGREYIGGSFKNVDYLRVPAEHKDHSWFLRYEGPGWESDKVGYRFYLDQRNAVDVFGKKVTEPVLQNVGQDNFDSYHEMQPWGMDILKVGKSLGLGSIGVLVNGAAVRVEETDSVTCRILENGPVFSSFATDYFGWKAGSKKTNLYVTTSIHAGTRLTRQQIRLDGKFDVLCTGIGKDAAAPAFSFKGSADSYGYLATYGKQSLNNDEVGLVIFFAPAALGEFTSDADSHIVTLRSSNNSIEYYFGAAWVLEKDGLRDKESFERWVKRTASELARPVKVVTK